MEKLLAATLELLLPLRSLDSPEQINSLLADLGYAVPDNVSLPDSPIDFQAAMGESIAVSMRLQTAITLEDRLASLQEAYNLARNIWDGINSLQNSLSAALQTSPQFLNTTDFQNQFLKRLVDYLVITYLQKVAPREYSLLELIGFSESVPQEEDLDAFRSACILRSLHLERIPALIQSPRDVFNELYQWDSQFDSNQFLQKLSQVMVAFGLPGNLLPDHTPGYEPVADQPESERQLFMPLFSGGSWPTTYWQFGIQARGYEPGGNEKKGLAIVPYTEGTVQASVPLIGDLRLILDVGANLDEGLGVFILPPAKLEVEQGLFFQPVPASDAAVSLELTNVGTSQDVVLLGLAEQTYFGAKTFSLKGGVTVGNGSKDIYTELSLLDWSLVVNPGDGDSFIQHILAALPLQVGGDLTLGYSLNKGFYLLGGAGLEFRIVLEKTLGPVTLDYVAFNLVLEASRLDLEASVTGGLALGPFAVVIEHIGLKACIDWNATQGRLGYIDFYTTFKPPTGIGLGIDLEGIITGGGYLSIEDGRYAGVAALQMFGVGLTVIGIIETELPDDPNGWSMFLSVIADFTPVPLGFGFFLSGVGGFMGLHRTLDEIALAEGVRDGRIDSLLFPEDPLADAMRIISDIEAYFPTQQDTHAFGAMARIDWGVPALISGELGVVLVVPDFRIAVVGEIESLLPTPAAPLIELHMGVVGYIDPAEATFWVTASIYDSRLVQYALSGDMAMYVSLGDQPYFLLTVGGFHPDWTPPGYVPSSMTSLRRMTAAIDLGADLQVGLEAYFAITPNTLQFGAEVFAIAEMKKLGVDFRARGDFGFDVLVIFTPFSIAADMDANVSIEAEGVPLLTAKVTLHLEGPEPWFGRATATFDFHGLPIDFNVAFGGSIKDEAPDAIDLWDQLEPALRASEAWSTPAIAASITTETTLRPLDELSETGLWLAPDGALELRQRVLPLNQTIEVFGAYVPDGESRFNVEAAGLSTGVGADPKSIEDWFAPAQFVTMGPTERLSAPSFEEMDAGISFSTSGFAVPQAQEDVVSVDLEYEELVLEQDTRKFGRHALSAERFGLGPRFPMFTSGAPASRRTVSHVTPFKVTSPRYDVADAFDASRIKRGGLYANAVIARRGTVSSTNSRARIVPTSAIQEKTV